MNKIGVSITMASLLTATLAVASDPAAKTEVPAAKAAPAKGTKKEGSDMSKDAAIATIKAAIDKAIADKTIDQKKPGWKEALPKFPAITFAKGATYFWNLKTNQGDIKVKLFPESAPNHVASTIYLTQLGYYDDTIFHRVITGFMAQGGDPTGTGRGGPGYRYDGEFDGKQKHDRPGILSAANAGPGTDGSQFFLTFVPTAWLDGKHSIYGEVVGGMDTVKALEKRGSQSGAPSEPLKLVKATITLE